MFSQEFKSIQKNFQNFKIFKAPSQNFRLLGLSGTPEITDWNTSILRVISVRMALIFKKLANFRWNRFFVHFLLPKVRKIFAVWPDSRIDFDWLGSTKQECGGSKKLIQLQFGFGSYPGLDILPFSTPLAFGTFRNFSEIFLNYCWNTLYFISHNEKRMIDQPKIAIYLKLFKLLIT